MILHRFIIGIQFSERMFRLPSVGGLLIDEILKLRTTDKKIGLDFFSQVNTPNVGAVDYAISIMSSNKENELIIRAYDFVFKKTAKSSISAINIEKTIEEFIILWKAANKIINFNETRRIGFVGEFRSKESKKGEGSNELLRALTKFQAKGQCSKFQLQFEDRELKPDGGVVDPEIDDYWHRIYSYYTSKIDETPDDEMLNANVDLQKYYNPAKKDPVNELKIVLQQFKKEKENFKKKMKELGITQDE
jgi:hypothetical protein